MASQRICSIPGCDKPHKANGLCNSHHLQEYQKARETWPICSVPDCENTARSASACHCEKHYGRLRRNGTLNNLERAPVLVHSGGYYRAYAPEHPLRNGKVGRYEYEHRVRFYNEHGAGPFNCHHCGKQVTWDDMHVDHLNDDPKDNRLGNLVASCPRCNQWRGRAKMRRSMRERHATKITFRGETKTAAEWANELGIARSALRARLKAGWTLDRALTEPRGKFGPRARHE